MENGDGSMVVAIMKAADGKIGDSKMERVIRVKIFGDLRLETRKFSRLKQ